MPTRWRTSQHFIQRSSVTTAWSKGEKPIDSATIITTDPNPLMATMHDRMLVILPAEAYGVWLDPEFQDKAEGQSLLRPYPEDEMETIPVSTLINSPKDDDPCCVNPL